MSLIGVGAKRFDTLRRGGGGGIKGARSTQAYNNIQDSIDDDQLQNDVDATGEKAFSIDQCSFEDKERSRRCSHLDHPTTFSSSSVNTKSNKIRKGFLRSRYDQTSISFDESDFVQQPNVKLYFDSCSSFSQPCSPRYTNTNDQDCQQSRMKQQLHLFTADVNRRRSDVNHNSTDFTVDKMKVKNVLSCNMDDHQQQQQQQRRYNIDQIRQSRFAENRQESFNTLQRRRQLPPTPADRNNQADTTSSSSSATLVQVVETVAMPSVAAAAAQHFQLNPAPVRRKLPPAPDFSDQIKSRGYHNRCKQDEDIDSARHCKTPSPTAISSAASDDERPRADSASKCYPPLLHANSLSSPSSRRYCQRRGSEQSVDQYVGVPCTCSSLALCQSTTSEPCSESKSSSSDTDDASTPNTVPVEQPRHKTVTGTLSEPFFVYPPSSVGDASTYEVDLDERTYGLGTLLFSLQYFPLRKRLRATVLKVENLCSTTSASSSLDVELNSFVKVCLLPGKTQKQRSSRVVKGNREAVFNEEFFFDNISLSEVRTMSVLFRLCHRSTKQLQKDVVVGELDSPLASLTRTSFKKEIKLRRELKPKIVKKLGRIYLSTLVELEDKRLTINILKVDNLPRFGINSPPDPFVEITVEQNGNSPQTKQTRTLKRTCAATFKESVMFLISTKKEDLEKTKIDVSVHDSARLNSLIGHMTLGCGSEEKTLIDLWRSTFCNSGKEFKCKQTLKGQDHVDV